MHAEERGIERRQVAVARGLHLNSARRGGSGSPLPDTIRLRVRMLAPSTVIAIGSC